jgi:superoxide dismutase, Fe-Mn family
MTHLNRRQLLRSAGAGLATLALSPLCAVARDTAKAAAPAGFTLPPLPYAYDALEPSIDKETMQIHHDKHHAAYVKNLNAALKDHPDFLKMDVVEVLKNVEKLPKEIQQAVINNGGGHLNHSLFWNWMTPPSLTGPVAPSGALDKAIDAAFGSFAKFQEKLSTAGVKQFGSGWAWLVLDKGKLAVVSSANQNSPVLTGATPLLGVDVWEHAYYLKYQNRRPEYIAAWWNVVNWKDVDERYGAALKGS